MNRRPMMPKTYEEFEKMRSNLPSNHPHKNFTKKEFEEFVKSMQSGEVKPNKMLHEDDILKEQDVKSNFKPEVKTQQMPQGMRGPGGQRGPMIKEKANNSKQATIRVVSYLSAFKGTLIFLIICIIIATVGSILAPIFQGYAIEAITITSENTVANIELMVEYLFIMIVLYIIYAIFAFMQNYTTATLSQKALVKMRLDLFEKIIKLPIGYVDRHPHGDIMSRMTNDVDNISNTFSSSLASIISGVLMLVGTYIAMLILSWQLALVSLVSVFLTFLVTKCLTGAMRKHYKERQMYLGKLNTITEEMVTGCKTVKAYNYSDTAITEFAETSKKLKTVSIKADILSGSMGPIMNVVGQVGYILICVVGGILALETYGIISVGIIATFIIFSKQFTRPINEIANLWGQIQSALAGAERIFELYDQELEGNEGTKDFDVNDLTLQFENVNFGYLPNKPVLNNFTLDVKQGEKIALVGHTGSGKTTVVNLLMRFYEINSGSIKIDGVDIKDFKMEELRRNIGIVLQDAVLFRDTIKNNISYAKPDATLEEIIEVSKIANCNYFITRFEDKYDTMLHAGGENISQGQRQLLTIARAILANPKILILDEATSSVDTRTEKHIQDAMAKLMHERTSLIIAHRLSTIVDADKIVVLDNGNILEVGNHEELLALKGKYYDLYQTQFSGQQT